MKLPLLHAVLFSCLLNTFTHGQKSGKMGPFDGSSGIPPAFEESSYPTVFIATLVRNKAHTLPYFLTTLENQDYPRDRIAIWMKSDHNEDNTTAILRAWGQDMQDWGLYHYVSVDVIDSPPFRHSDQETAFHWSSKRFQHVMQLKEEAIQVARKMWADYIFFLDADVFLVNNQSLKQLVAKGKDLVAPMLQSGGLYSNFWGGMKDYYYIRSDDYQDLIHWKKTGCFQVPLIHSAVLMNIKKKDIPEFRPLNDTIPEDDVIQFATSAESKGIPMEICNDMEYGFILSPVEDESGYNTDNLRLQNLRTEISSYWSEGLPVNDFLQEFVPQQLPPSTIGFDQVYLINLKRRPDRLKKMDNVFRILGIDYTHVEAVDGSELTPESLTEMGIKQLKEYRDPYSQRLMTVGEIGCFLSHHKIWEQMVKFHVNSALVLEDDVRFEPYFVYQMQRVLEETAKLSLDWDLIYLGRKRSSNADEAWVTGSQHLVHVDYTYWTLGYALTLRGAKKLLDAKPFQKLVPVDEFLPIMFDKHPNMTWRLAYETRNLNAFSVEPLLLYPTHYTSEAGYISDTERSIPLPGNCTIKEKDEL